MSRTLFRHRRHPRHGRRRADHARLHAPPRPCRRPGAAPGRAPPDRPDRQGHAHLRLHDRVGARGRLRLGRRRRRPHRPAADARRRLPDAGAAPRPRRRHQRLAQPVRRQRHQVLLGAWREAARRVGGRGRGSARRRAAVGRLGRARPRAPARRRERPLRRVLQEHLQQRPDAARPVDRRRRCPRRRVPRRARRLPRARRRGDVDRLPPDGFNINAGFGATAPQALVDAVVAGGADYGIALDGDGDRLQVVDGAGRLYNGDELLYVLAAARLDHGRPCRASSAR